MYKNIFTKGGAMAALLLLVSFSFSFAHWSTRGPYGGSVSAFATVDSFTFLGSPFGGVYRATNTQLTTWIYRNYTALGSGKITSLTAIGKKLLAATADSGVYISNDYGVTWAASNSGLTNLQVLTLATNANGKIFAGTNGGGAYLSTDSGATWSGINTGLSASTVTSFVTLGDSVMAGTAGGGVFLTLNAGGSWLGFSNGLTDLNVNALAVSLTTFKAYAATPTGVYEGSLLSFTWSAVNAGLTSPYTNTLLINGNNLYAGTNAGVFSTPVSSINWAVAGTSTDTVKALTVYGSNILAGTSNAGVLKSALSSIIWASANAGFNNLRSYATAAKDSLVVVANEKGLFVCKNFVLSAVYVSSGNGIADSTHISAIVIDGGKLYVTNSNGVYVSNDTGANWTTINTGLTDLNVSKLIATAGKLYAITVSGKAFSTPVSTVNWIENSTGLPANIIVTDIAARNDTVVLAGGTDGLYANVGSGVLWVNTGLVQNVTSVAISDKYVFAGTATAGVFRLPLNGQTWTAVNNGLNSQNIQAIDVVDQYVLVGYHGGAQATCSSGNLWHNFGTLQYIPNYSPVLGFTHITPRIFALTPGHGLLGNGKGEFPEEAVIDTISLISGSVNVCAGSAAAYQVTPDEDVENYTWAFPAGWSNVVENNNLASGTAGVAGNVTITLTAANGCGTETRSLTVTVDALPTVALTLPVENICYDAAAITLTGGSPAGGTYGGAGVSGGSFNPSLVNPGVTVISYSYTSNEGCSGNATANLTVFNCTGITETGIETVQLYPNPFTDVLYVNTANVSGDAVLTLTDVTGKAIITMPVNKTVMGLSTVNIANGIYTLSLTTNGKVTATHKVVKAE